MHTILTAVLTLCLCFDVFPVALAQQQHFASQKLHVQPKKTAITPELKQFIEDLRHNSTIPGLSVAVVHSGGKVELDGFGIRSEDGDKVTTDTLFNLASCSKAFLTGSVGILMDDFAAGRNVTPLPDGVEIFDWRTKVQDILPDDWKLMDEHASQKATFRDILSHMSGLSAHDLAYSPADSPVDIIRRMRQIRPSYELREKFQYNNQMYMLTSHVISLYSGMPYIEFVKERIFKPLNMSSTTFSESEATKGGLFTQTFSADGRRIPFFIPDPVKVVNAGPGGVISTAHDLSRWVRVFLNGGVDPVTNVTILPRSVYEAVTSVQSIVFPTAPFPEFSFFGYGFGWNRYSYQGHEILGHSGGIPGVSTQIAFLPGDDIGIVVLCNASGRADQTVAILYRILEDLLGLPRLASTRYAAGVKPEAFPKPETRSPWTPPVAEWERNAISAGGLPLEEFAGIYTNPGYPNFTICAPGTSEQSAACESMLTDFNRVENISSSKQTLYIGLFSLFAHNARLSRSANRDGTRFQLGATYLFPDGYGKDTSPFELTELSEFTADVDFVVEDGKVLGFALNGIGVEGVTDRQRKGGSVQETADVWFEKA